MSARIDLDGLVNGVVDRLAGRLGKRSGIFILASPGCSRGRLVTVLLRRGLVDVVYAYGGFGSKVGDDVRDRVNEFGSIDELAGKLGSVNGRVAVVARSTTDAIRLRDRLGNAEVIYLPKYYEDAAKEVLSGGVPEVAKVRHEGLGEGISPSMLREGVPSEVVESIRKLSPGRLGLRDLIKDFLKKAPMGVAAQAITLGLSFLLGAGVAVSLAGSLAGKFLESVVGRWRKNKDEVLGGFARLVGAAREVRNYLGDERFESVVDEVAYEWGLSIEEFTNTITNIANITERKQLTKKDIKKIINDKLKSIEKELNEVKTKVEGLLVGVKVFFIDDIERGLFYGNFIVKGGVPRIKTLLGTAKNELVTDLIDAGRFREVAEGVFSRLVKDGRVVLIGPRGIGKSTLATYVAWRSLLGGLGNVALNEQLRDAVIRVDLLNPGDAVKLNNLVEATGRRFVIIYDPSPIEAYYKPETMQVVKHDIKGIRETLKELMEVRNAWVVIILPRELYDEVSKDVALRSILDEIRSYIIDMNLRDEGFLREVTRKYSGCDDVSDDLVKGVMGFDSYTLVAKYVGIWLRERRCEIKDVDETLRESAGEPKLFFANYMWSTVLGGNEDLAKRVSIPLILHAVFGPIPEGITYITKAVNEGGVWRLIDRDSLAKSKLEDLREDDLEPIAKWLSTWHEDLIEETLKDLVGLHGGEPRKHYIDRGFRDLIETLKWGYEKALEEVRGLGNEVKPEKVKTNLLIFVGERLKNALKPYTNCWKRAALIIGYASAGYDSVPRPEDLPKDLLENVAKFLGDALNGCEIDDYLLVGNEIPLLIMGLVHARVLSEAFVDEYDGAVGEVDRVLEIVGNRGRIYGAEGVYGLGLASIIAKAVESGKPIKSGDADAALRLASFTMRFIASTDYVEPILRTLEPLHDETPHRYLGLLAFASDIENLNPNTVKYIFGKLNYVLNNYGDRVKEYAWSLVHAIDAYSNLLRRYLNYFKGEIAYIVDKVTDLLNKLSNAESYVNVIAWAFILTPALIHEDVRRLIEGKLHSDVVSKANEILTRLDELKRKIERESIEELRNSDKDFVNYVESKSVGASKETVREEVLDTALFLSHELAIYRLHNDELDEAAKLFNKVAKGYREIGNYENYLVDRGWILRVKAIKNLLVSDELAKLANGFKQLYKKTFSKEHLKPTASYLSNASSTLGEYLVSLALMNDIKKIDKLLKKHWNILNFNKEVSVLTRLTLNVLLNPKSELSSELKGKLTIQPAELFMAFKDKMRNEVMTIMSDRDAIERLRGELIRNLHGLGLVKGLNTEINEFIINLINKLNGESLVQLIAPISSRARLALMLYALINNNVELAKAHAALGAMEIPNKLPTRLFLEAYRACCDLKNSEEFRRAIAKLFFFHV